MTTPEMLRQSWRAWLSRAAQPGGRWWLTPVWTLVFCAVVALGITLAIRVPGSIEKSWWAWYRANLIVSTSIGFAVRGAMSLADGIVGRARVMRWPSWLRSVYFFMTSLAGVVVGWPLGVYWGTGVDLRALLVVEHPEMLATSVIVAVLITALFAQFFTSKARQIRAENAATEAQLRLLQAQIEPHFLFNTLANVTALMESDTPRAKLMLESFVDYLRASLSGLGDDSHTLGDEIDLVEAYLRIVKIRMEDRLDYTITVADDLRALPLPALTLQPLVENAVVHGLEPRIEGGRVHVSARLDGRTLLLGVDDDGAGLAAAAGEGASPGRRSTAGTGTALANIRRRIGQSHGSGARLTIDADAPHGVRARLSLPVTATRPAPAAA
ncbi:MAG: histidine kinase [Caldimonas sp.]